nr:p32K [Tern adenovirus]
MHTISFDQQHNLLGVGRPRKRRRTYNTSDSKKYVRKAQKKRQIKAKKHVMKKKPQLPKVIYVKPPPINDRFNPSSTIRHFPSSTWSGVQFPSTTSRQYNSFNPNQYIFDNQQYFNTKRNEVSNDIFYDAVTDIKGRRPTDGENDTDDVVKNKWNIDEVLDFLVKLPERIRKSVLISLFGTAVGIVIDLILGSPLGITTKIIRGILNIIPAGWIILAAFDGLGYLLGKGKQVLSLPYDPGFVELANRVQSEIPEHTAEELAHIADRQLGSGTIAATLTALLHAVFLRHR